jgi:hypothetical protein
MAYPVYEDNGGIAAGQDAAVDVPYPATVNENDILVVIVGDADDDSFSTPSGWTKIVDFTTDGAFSIAWFWKRAVGDESGSETFTSALSAGQVVAGVMLRFSGCKTTGDPFDIDVQTSGVTQSSTATIGSIDTSGSERLCCCLIGIEDNTGCDNDATDYSEVVDVTTTTGSDMGFCLYTRQMASAGTVPADSVGVGGNDFWATLVIALAPPDDGDKTINVNDAPTGADSITPAMGDMGVNVADCPKPIDKLT